MIQIRWIGCDLSPASSRGTPLTVFLKIRIYPSHLQVASALLLFLESLP
jgi:hypothetical protein